MLRLVEEHGTRYWALIGNDLHFPSFSSSLCLYSINMKMMMMMMMIWLSYPVVIGAKLNGRTGKQVYTYMIDWLIDWLIDCSVVHNIMHCLKLHINIHIEQSRFETVLLWIFFTFTTTSYYFDILSPIWYCLIIF